MASMMSESARRSTMSEFPLGRASSLVGRPEAGGIFRPSSMSSVGRMIYRYPQRSVALRRVDRARGSGSRRMATHDSVRVEFESTIGPRRHGFESPRGIGRGWPTPWPSRDTGKQSWQRRRRVVSRRRKPIRPLRIVAPGGSAARLAPDPRLAPAIPTPLRSTTIPCTSPRDPRAITMPTLAFAHPERPNGALPGPGAGGRGEQPGSRLDRARRPPPQRRGR